MIQGFFEFSASKSFLNRAKADSKAAWWLVISVQANTRCLAKTLRDGRR
jgi:hypothetical protein